MNELEIKKVPFMGSKLLAVRNESGIWAGVRWMCEGIGLSDGQTKNERLKIQKDKVLSKGGRNFVLNESGYGNREVLCLKLDFLPLWLAKISITPTMEAETPELAARLMEYQLKVKDVLAAAFLPVAAVPALDTLSPELRLLINMELKQKEQEKALEAMNQRIDDIRDVVALSPNSWRKDASRLIVKIAHRMGGTEHIQDVYTEVYRLVNERAGVSLETRLTNKRRRMAEEGECLTARKRLTMVDVIADDRKLIEIYLAIVKEMAVKYGVHMDAEAS
jgi:hypothetical protein